MPIDNRTLEPGTVLTARYKKQDLTCEVVQTDEGVRYRFEGTDYKSPSSAGKAAMNGVACNGWRFWSVAGTERPRRGAKAKSERAASRASYECGACGQTFPSLKAATQHALTHTAS